MGWLDLLRPMPRPAKRAATGRRLIERLRLALERPPHPNRYVAPRLRTIDAALYALRGYHVYWTPASWGSPSVLIYDVRSASGDIHGVEVATVMPGRLHQAAAWARSARVVGIRFALWQARQDLWRGR